MVAMQAGRGVAERPIRCGDTGGEVVRRERLCFVETEAHSRRIEWACVAWAELARARGCRSWSLVSERDEIAGPLKIGYLARTIRVSSRAASKGRRWCSIRALRTMTLLLPVSSFRVGNMTPAAEAGRWWPVTKPAMRARRPWRRRFGSAAVNIPGRRSSGRNRAGGWRPRMRPGWA
jgi:hypothetical protein